MKADEFIKRNVKQERPVAQLPQQQPQQEANQPTAQKNGGEGYSNEGDSSENFQSVLGELGGVVGEMLDAQSEDVNSRITLMVNAIRLILQNTDISDDVFNEVSDILDGIE